jgi:hypothetical protein
VSLANTVLEGAGCRVELGAWEPFEQHGFHLSARCEPPDAWPDSRVVAESSSTSLWSRPPTEGEFSAALPLNHAELFSEPRVELVLRMVGHRIRGLTLQGAMTALAR